MGLNVKLNLILILIFDQLPVETSNKSLAGL